jgi:hypothetical protein
MARRALLFKKLRLCSHMFDLSDQAQQELETLSPAAQATQMRLRETKRSTMLELVNFFTLARPCWQADELQALFEMLSFNLLRPLPPSSFEQFQWHGRIPGGAGGGAGGHCFSPEEDPHQDDPDWSSEHGALQAAYELLLRVVSTLPNQSAVAASAAAFAEHDHDNPFPEPPATLMQIQASHKLLYGTHLNRKFLAALLHNFGSEDSRERDYVKTVLHRVYAQAMSLRPFLRRCLQHLLCRLIYEDERGHGVAEMLEVLGSIINGFAVPLKPTHVDVLLRRVLLPLHKLSSLGLFHPQLSYAVLQYLDKDPSLANHVLLALLKYWPRTNSKKELLVLNEVEEVLERLPPLRPRRPQPQQSTQQQLPPPTKRPGTAGSMANGSSRPSTAAGGGRASAAASLPGALPDDCVHLSVLYALTQQLCACVHSTHFQVSEKALALLSDTSSEEKSFLHKFVFFDAEATSAATAGDFRATLVPLLAQAVYANTEAPLINLMGPVPPAAAAAAVVAAAAQKSPPKTTKPKHIRPLSGKSVAAAAAGIDAGEALLLSSSRANSAAAAAAASAPPSAHQADGARGHWNPAIGELTAGLVDALRGEDGPLFNSCMKHVRAEARLRGQQQQQQQQQQQILQPHPHSRSSSSGSAFASDNSVCVNLADAFAAVKLQDQQRQSMA